MATLAVELHFSDVNSCVAFASELEKPEYEHDAFSLALPERKLHADSHIFTLLLEFMKDGGLPAVTAFLLLARDVLNKVAPGKKAEIATAKREKKKPKKSKAKKETKATKVNKTEISGSLSNEQIEKIAKQFLADVSDDAIDAEE